MRRVRRATGTKPDVKWEFVPIHQIPDFLVTLADIGESLSSHMCHHGFTWFGYYLAYLNNRRGLLLRGYSNISQQTAKNLFLPFRRKMWRKLLEAYYTILIELLWGKKRIMEYYLNIAEFGPGIYGCQAGCQHYFGHGIDQLTLDEGFMLIATLPGPCMHNPFNQTDYWNKVKGDIVSRYNPLCQTDLDHRPVVYSSRQEYAMQWSCAQFVLAVVFNELLILMVSSINSTLESDEINYHFSVISMPLSASFTFSVGYNAPHCALLRRRNLLETFNEITRKQFIEPTL